MLPAQGLIVSGHRARLRLAARCPENQKQPRNPGSSLRKLVGLVCLGVGVPSEKPTTSYVATSSKEALRAIEPLLHRQARVSQNSLEQRKADVSAMWIRQLGHEVASHHEFRVLSGSSVWTCEPEFLKALDEIPALSLPRRLH